LTFVNIGSSVFIVTDVDLTSIKQESGYVRAAHLQSNFCFSCCLYSVDQLFNWLLAV